jgi:glutathione S-transferase
MKLYYSATSPYVRKVNVCAIELGLDEKLERILTNPWEKDDKLLADNPLSKVPTLITDDGVVLYDSPVICEYLDTVQGGGALIPASGTEHWNELRLQALGDGILDAAVLRFLERKRPNSQQSSEWDGIQQSAIQRVLEYLESKVNEWKADVTIGQIAVACALGYLDFRFAEDNWRQGHPGLTSWFETFAQRESMQATVPKIPQ